MTDHRVIDWIKVLIPTWHKISYFGDAIGHLLGVWTVKNKLGDSCKAWRAEAQGPEKPRKGIGFLGSGQLVPAHQRIGLGRLKHPQWGLLKGFLVFSRRQMASLELVILLIF